MTIDYKKAIFISLFIIVTMVIAYLLYAVFFKSSPPSTPAPETSSPGITGFPEADLGSPGGIINPGGQLPSEGSGDLGTNEPGGNNLETATVGEEASFATIDQVGSPRFYNSNDNRFYTVAQNGELVALSNQQFFNVQNVIWSPQGDRAILEYPDGNNIRYDFSRNHQVTLPQHWEDFAFAPSGDKIVAKSIGLDPDNRWLVVANDDGSKSQTIEPLGENGDQVISSWSPNNQSIAFFVDGVDFNRKEVYFVGQHGENFKSLITEGRGFQPLWSPAGNDLVYSVYSADNDFKPTLWIVGAQGDTIGANRRPLNLNTWANKCSFNQTDLYCAVPTSLERGAGMFPALAQNTPDVLYRINTNTGQRELLPFSSTSSISNLSISADGTYLYYIENSTKQLKKIKIR